MNSMIRYINTIRYLKPSQIGCQIYRRVVHKKIKIYNRTVWKTQNVPLFLAELDLDDEYLQRFFPEKLLRNEITILHESFHWEQGKWNNPAASHLWNFNLHYFEYGIALAACYRKEKKDQYRLKLLEMIDDWIDEVREGDGWQAYTISLRIPNWLVAFKILGEPLPDKVLNSIYIQYRWLLRNQEKQLLGNHYFENLKTILICSHLFIEDRMFSHYIKKFIKEMRREILLDGVHFERSLMYHKIILEDLIRIALLLEKRKSSFLPEVLSAIQKMNTAMYSLEKGMGKTPHFNDAADNISKGMKQLCSAVKTKWKMQPGLKTEFPRAGYYKIFLNDIAAILDCGPLGPKYMCGHAHCDALSFELSIQDRPMLVNAGTYQYQDKRRAFFRSTQAHNTIMIGGQQQSELWGEHRAARRIRNIRCKYSKDRIKGSYSTYRGMHHERCLELSETGIKLIDQVTVSRERPISAFFHAAPGLCWEESGKNGYVLTSVENKNNEFQFTLRFLNGEAFVHRHDELCDYSEEFGKLEQCEVLELKYFAAKGTTENTVEILIDKRK